MNISALKLFCLWGRLRQRLYSLGRHSELNRPQAERNIRPKRKTKRVFLEMP